MGQKRDKAYDNMISASKEEPAADRGVSLKERNLMKTEKDLKVVNRVFDMLSNHFGLFSYRFLLPDTFAEDMKEMFGTDPETGIVSEVSIYVLEGIEGGEGVLSVIENTKDRKTIEEKMIPYVKENKIGNMFLLYTAENGRLFAAVGNNIEDSFLGEMEIVSHFDGCNVEGEFNLDFMDAVAGFATEDNPAG